MKFNDSLAVKAISRLGSKIGPTAAMPGMVNGERGICGKGILKVARFWEAVMLDERAMWDLKLCSWKER